MGNATLGALGQGYLGPMAFKAMNNFMPPYANPAAGGERQTGNWMQDTQPTPAENTQTGNWMQDTQPTPANPAVAGAPPGAPPQALARGPANGPPPGYGQPGPMMGHGFAPGFGGLGTMYGGSNPGLGARYWARLNNIGGT